LRIRGVPEGGCFKERKQEVSKEKKAERERNDTTNSGREKGPSEFWREIEGSA